MKITDKMRLDWMETYEPFVWGPKKAESVGREFTAWSVYSLRKEGKNISGAGRTLALAIDAAMRAEKKECGK